MFWVQGLRVLPLVSEVDWYNSAAAIAAAWHVPSPASGAPASQGRLQDANSTGRTLSAPLHAGVYSEDPSTRHPCIEEPSTGTLAGSPGDEETGGENGVSKGERHGGDPGNEACHAARGGQAEGSGGVEASQATVAVPTTPANPEDSDGLEGPQGDGPKRQESFRRRCLEEMWGAKLARALLKEVLDYQKLLKRA
jgi:hypothetical protein